MPKMKAQPDWLRAGVMSRPSVGVDRETNSIRGYVLAQEGPFKSDGRGEFNKQALADIVKLGNAKDAGLKVRFTHPDMSNDGLGKFLGRARSLELGKALDARSGKMVAAVRGDLFFDKTALEPPPDGGKALGVYVMDLTESDPDALSSSLVLRAREEWRLNKDGTLMTDDEGRELPPLWFPTELHASDIVDTGDAVDGLLSAETIDGLPLSALWRGEQLLNSVFDGQDRDTIQARLAGFIDKYLDRKFPAKPTPKLDAWADRLATMAGKVK